jgi:5'-phosphate synthase pdxT subunit
MKTAVGVLALQGAFLEHLTLLRKAADFIAKLGNKKDVATLFDFIEVRTKQQLSLCDALIIPGGESTAISLVAADCGLLEPLRDFVKYDSCPMRFS